MAETGKDVRIVVFRWRLFSLIIILLLVQNQVFFLLLPPLYHQLAVLSTVDQLFFFQRLECRCTHLSINCGSVCVHRVSLCVCGVSLQSETHLQNKKRTVFETNESKALLSSKKNGAGSSPTNQQCHPSDRDQGL